MLVFVVLSFITIMGVFIPTMRMIVSAMRVTVTVMCMTKGRHANKIYNQAKAAHRE